MINQPTLWNRFVAAMVGEISADTLEAYRRASLAVYDALDHAEAHRKSAKEAGQNAWTLPPSTKAEILCTWNAFVLQTLGDQILNADYVNHPPTRGYVPAITADQILAFYVQVEGWLSRANQAHWNPDYKLDIAVPADLPDWSEVGPCPTAHLKGILEAMRAVRDHTQVALMFLNDSPPQTEEQKKQLNVIRQIQANCQTKARYAEDMMTVNPSRDVHERVEEHAKAAIEGFYLLGQLLAMPEAADKIGQPKPLPRPDTRDEDLLRDAFPSYQSPPRPSLANIYRLAKPDEENFDMWCLTDPDSVAKFKQDREAVRAIKNLWRLDPDAGRTVDIQSDINAALSRGDITYALDRYGKKLGHFFCAPWGAVYEVKSPLTIAGTRLKVAQQFIFNVTCEGVNLGAPFERELLVANFIPTAKFEYGNPDEEPDH